MTVLPEDRGRAGAEAESAACRFLEGLGLRIVERNARVRRGEIDIVARDGGVLVFVEVRFRGTDGFGLPEESVGRGKRMRIIAAARRYLSRVSPGEWEDARFDVVAITGSGDAADIRHYPNAFDAKGKII